MKGTPTLLSLAVAAGGVAAQSPDAPRVRFTTTAGEFIVELYPDKAPKTVENFLQYVRDKHYDGTIFHRVIDNFMIQGGGFTPDLKQKPTHDPIPNEAKNGLKNGRGTIAMARTPLATTHPRRRPCFHSARQNILFPFRPIGPVSALLKGRDYRREVRGDRFLSAFRDRVAAQLAVQAVQIARRVGRSAITLGMPDHLGQAVHGVVQCRASRKTISPLPARCLA